LAKTEHPVQIRVLTDDDLANMSQMFFCNALRGIMPVTALTLLSGNVVSF
jgi:4-amino-4-deoxychorismate lyase